MPNTDIANKIKRYWSVWPRQISW